MSDTNLENAIKVRLFDNYLEKVQIVDPFTETAATFEQSELPGLVEMYRRYGDEGIRALIHEKVGLDQPFMITADYLLAREFLKARGAA